MLVIWIEINIQNEPKNRICNSIWIMTPDTGVAVYLLWNIKVNENFRMKKKKMQLHCKKCV